MSSALGSNMSAIKWVVRKWRILRQRVLWTLTSFGNTVMAKRTCFVYLWQRLNKNNDDSCMCVPPTLWRHLFGGICQLKFYFILRWLVHGVTPFILMSYKEVLVNQNVTIYSDGSCMNEPPLLWAHIEKVPVNQNVTLYSEDSCMAYPFPYDII